MFARSTITATSAVVAIATLGLAPATAAEPAIPLSGGQETSAADVDGHGFFSYSIDGATFCWTLSWQDIATPSAAHVHVGPRHVAGPVVIPLDVDGVPGPDMVGCTTISAELAAAISANPGGYYANVHNADFPAGAIRGQLK
jgi:CHRD domain